MKLALKVIPNAKKSEAAGWEDDPRAGRVLKLRIAAPPVEGKANRAVILFLSAWLDVPRSAVSLLRGESARLKVVELPVSATEDRVVGTLDIEQAIKHGEKKFEAGILALANRNILYVDEINLLDDHVVDVLLDAAAMGINTVEREGVSYSHPARFVLVGTMNPEEGDIRPQLLDRFGLSVTVTGEHDPVKRVEVIKRRLAYETDAEKFIAGYQKEQEALASTITQAQKTLRQVTVDDAILAKVAELAVALGVDGHRADITVIKTAMTLAAFAKRTKVNLEDVKGAAKLALPHRMRRRPFEEGTLSMDKVTDILDGKITEAQHA